MLGSAPPSTDQMGFRQYTKSSNPDGYLNRSYKLHAPKKNYNANNAQSLLSQIVKIVQVIKLPHDHVVINSKPFSEQTSAQSQAKFLRPKSIAVRHLGYHQSADHSISCQLKRQFKASRHRHPCCRTRHSTLLCDFNLLVCICKSSH